MWLSSVTGECMQPLQVTRFALSTRLSVHQQLHLKPSPDPHAQAIYSSAENARAALSAVLPRTRNETLFEDTIQ